jgi:hypothetical protein
LEIFKPSNMAAEHVEVPEAEAVMERMEQGDAATKIAEDAAIAMESAVPACQTAGLCPK